MTALKILLAGGFLTLALIAKPSVAATYSYDTVEATCETFREMAEVTMVARFGGANLHSMLAIADSIDDVPTIARDMVLRAYTSPRYTTEGLQDYAIRNFGDRYYAECAGYLK